MSLHYMPCIGWELMPSRSCALGGLHESMAQFVKRFRQVHVVSVIPDRTEGSGVASGVRDAREIACMPDVF
jgi:hypothetical protein